MVDENWPDEMDSDEAIPEDRDKAIERYFDVMRENPSRYENYFIEHAPINLAKAEQTIVPELIAALKVSLNEGGITSDTMVYSENDHGKRVYLKDLFEGLLKRAEADSK